MDVLRPSEQAPYFDVRETVVTGTGAAVSVALADAERVYLGIYPTTANQTVSVSTVAKNLPANGRLVQAQFPMELFHSMHGPLVAQQWFASSGAGITTNVIEVFLRRFPSPNLEGLSP